MTVAATKIPQMQNPFRTSSRLHNIFSLLADEKVHTLRALTQAGWGGSYDAHPGSRRRTSSAIRTIRATLRKKDIGTITYRDPFYRLVTD